MIALLDTNAYTALARGDETLLVTLGAASRVLMPTVVVGELEYGFRFGDRYAHNRAQLDAFLAEDYVEVLVIGRRTTIEYGRLCAELRRQGRRIPSNDAWIAALACEHEAVIMSRDRHLRIVPGISVSDW